MTGKRIRNTSQAAAELGMSVRAFLQLRYDSAFPKPVIDRGGKRGHHFWWDMKAIEQFFDTKNGLTVQSAGWGERILKGLAGGEGASGILDRAPV